LRFLFASLSRVVCPLHARARVLSPLTGFPFPFFRVSQHISRSKSSLTSLGRLEGDRCHRTKRTQMSDIHGPFSPPESQTQNMRHLWVSYSSSLCPPGPPSSFVLFSHSPTTRRSSGSMCVHVYIFLVSPFFFIQLSFISAQLSSSLSSPPIWSD